MSNRAARLYKTVDLESAPKTQIVERLFERFARDLTDARRAIEARDIGSKARALDHATQIVVQLRSALDHRAAPELCANLDALYRFVIDQLARANSKLDVKPLAHCERVMGTLGDGFRRAHEMVR